MSRMSVGISADAPEEKIIFEAWLAKWKEKIVYLSENYGCGCCVELYDIEGPDEAIEDIPPSIQMSSEWTRNGVKSGKPECDAVQKGSSSTITHHKRP